ncbi:MAG TPA: YsnF/AvaK domain-containing protein [Allosphingosinicella sp.]
MSSTVTAMYDTREEAERALQALKAEASLAHAGVYDSSPASLEALQRIALTPDERAACEEKLATGDYMLLAQVRSGEDPGRIIAILERIGDDDPPKSQWEEFRPAPGATENGSRVVAEERVPVVEEELRVGTREVLRGGARVRSRVQEVPVAEDVELIEEFVRVEKRPASRSVTEQELEQAGLLRERVIEIAQVREEAVVTKEAFVREEVVVSKTTERRVEQIHETVRRTEVETEELGVQSAGER